VPNGKVLVTLSGPSCVGKGPLQKAVERFYPGLLSCRPVLYHSRHPRPGEFHGRDYYFLPASEVRSLAAAAAPDMVLARVRGDWQALDMGHVADLLDGNDLVFAEVYHTFLGELTAAAKHAGVEVRSIFLLPAELPASDSHIITTMRDKLDRRGLDSEEKAKERSESAPEEVGSGFRATHRLINIAGEDDTDEWGEFGIRDGKKGEREIRTPPDLGERARWLVERFVEIVQQSKLGGTYRYPDKDPT